MGSCVSALVEVLDAFIEKVVTPWEKYLRVADRYIPACERVFLQAVGRVKESISLSQLGEAVVRHSQEDIEEKIDWSRFTAKVADFQSLMFEVLCESGKLAAEDFKEYLRQKQVRKSDEDREETVPPSRPDVGTVGEGLDISFSLNFNMRNPWAIEWARVKSSALIQQISEESREAIRTLIKEAFEKGGHPYEVARKIRDYIGLTDYQMKVVLNYQTRLDEEGRPRKQVDEMVDAKVRKMVRERAKTIARTETINSACAGQIAHWEDMIAKGYIDRESMRVEWITTPDDRLCEACRAMSGKRTRVGEVFEGTQVSHPTLHPRCRCAIRLVEIEEVSMTKSFTEVLKSWYGDDTTQEGPGSGDFGYTRDRRVKV